MDFLNDTLDMAKELFFVAKEKTGEVVAAGKQKIDIATLENKLNKLYARLGKNAYVLFKDEENIPPQIADIMAQIDTNRELLEKRKDELAKTQQKRACPCCKCIVSKNALFCPECGEKLEYEE